MKSLYSILNLENFSNIEEVKKSYKTLAKQYHPDKNIGDKNAENIFKQINEAYQTLGIAHKKQTYDDILAYKLHQNKQKEYSYTEPVKPNYQEAYQHEKARYAQGQNFEQVPTKPPSKLDTHFVIFALILAAAVTAILFGGFYMNHLAAENHLAEAKIYFNDKQYPAALFETKQALEFDDNFALVHELRGEILSIKKRDNAALQSFNQAIDNANAKDLSRYYLKRGKILLKLNKFDDALIDFQNSRLDAKTSDQSNFYIGIIQFYNYHNYSEALKSYQKIKDQDESVLVETSYCYLKIGDIENAKKYLILYFQKSKTPNQLSFQIANELGGVQF